ncbi:uncharacterized protein LOC135641435 [Musa acuminata AAA Group]|uniref:Uncharacterized protein n=1 Tax=Musa acuminata subsp. malaccensis TaxID=214687 RepID=A0A804JLN4_MUSAM|nr:PREDICTED: uncharacterized protein LOC103989217 [Musa acuminata subsp. malaccensis]
MSDASGRRRSRRGYRRLLSRQSSFDLAEGDEATTTAAAATVSEMKRSNTTREIKAHPVIRIMEKPPKKATATPEFLRYLEYMREAGTWHPNSDAPAIYFK